jgi:hypothetical protein
MLVFQDSARFLSASLVELDLEGNDIPEGGGRALGGAETLRLNTTLKSLNLCLNDLGKGGGRELAETLQPPFTSLQNDWPGVQKYWLFPQSRNSGQGKE